MMGSMLERPEQLKTVREWLMGLRYARTRAIVSLSGMDPVDREQFKNNESVYFVQSFIPHHWLFPKIAAVVHHGGAGTTHTGLYYGLPTLVLPFGADQPFNGDRVFINKLGPEPIPIRESTLGSSIYHWGVL
jgi:sterol 3beta-glucosyltransferase